jgi:hypothetical protein
MPVAGLFLLFVLGSVRAERQIRRHRSVPKRPRMNFSSLIAPAIVAALIAAIVSVIGFLINRATVRGIHDERIATDRDLAERRSAAEIALAERRFEHDLQMAERRAREEAALAERRFDYERALAAWRRRADLAEETLTACYEVREVITAARSPLSFVGEGETRQRAPDESESEARRLDAYFATVERLNRKAEVFAQLAARKYRFSAIFGAESAALYEELFSARHEIIVAVQMLIETYRDRNEGTLPNDRKEWEKIIGWRPIGEDPIARRIDLAIDAIERVCRPVLQKAVRDP